MLIWTDGSPFLRGVLTVLPLHSFLILGVSFFLRMGATDGDSLLSIVAGFLQECDLSKSLKALVKESGIELSQQDNVFNIKSAIQLLGKKSPLEEGDVPKVILAYLIQAGWKKSAKKLSKEGGISQEECETSLAEFVKKIEKKLTKKTLHVPSVVLNIGSNRSTTEEEQPTVAADTVEAADVTKAGKGKKRRKEEMDDSGALREEETEQPPTKKGKSEKSPNRREFLPLDVCLDHNHVI
eukprot:GHVN01070530.1.p1 GENE.GHVN01070530.1~~GHVN01070530.1.p1  ORF type:complete len:239 (-),score=39.92 GHVN01070530.1:497-1213(-)